SYRREGKKGPVGGFTLDRPVHCKLLILLSLRLRFLSRGPWMIRYCLYGVLVDHDYVSLGEVRAAWADPVIRRGGTGVSGTRRDSAGIDALLGFAARQVRLGVDRPFSAQVLALLIRCREAHDNQGGVRILLQARRHVVQHRFAGVVDAPRLRLVREVAGAQLAALWRRWRRYLHVDLGRGLRRQATRI